MTNSPNMSAPRSAQIPKTMESEPASNHSPEGQAARKGIGNDICLANPTAICPLVRWKMVEFRKKTTKKSRPTSRVQAAASLIAPPCENQHLASVFLKSRVDFAFSRSLLG